MFRLLEISLNQWSMSIKKDVAVIDIKLTDREENILRYVAGFIPYSLKKIFSKIDTLEAKSVLQVIEAWRAPSDKGNVVTAISFLNYTRKWVEEKNKGGLFTVNDEFYIFICRLENIARTVFNKDLTETYQDEDLRDVLTPKMLESKLFNEAWERLYRNIDNPALTKALFRLIINKWVNIRANAFAEAYVNIVKTKYKDVASGKAQPSMRKCLK